MNNKSMTTLELAHEFHVALFETSKELNWQDKTLFCWVETSKGEIKIWQQSIFDYMLSKASEYGKDILEVPKRLFAALQMEDIAKLLPTTLITDNGEIEFLYKYFNNGDLIHRIGYYHNYSDYYDIYVTINNHNYAQAFVELYLKVKSILSNGQ